MRKIVEGIKKHKKAIVITIISIVGIIALMVGVFTWMTQQKKKYEVESISKHAYYLLSQNGNMGVIDTKGNIVIEPIYYKIIIPNPEKDIFICEINGEITVQNKNKDIIFSEYEQVTPIDIRGTISNVPYEKQVLRYLQQGKYGLITYEGKLVTQPIYDSIQGLENKESELLVEQNGKYGVINQKGARILPCEYDNIIADGYYDEQLQYALSGYITMTKTQEGYRYGYQNEKGQMVLAQEYNEIHRVLELEDPKATYLTVTKNGQVGLVKNGSVLIDYAYQSIEYDTSNQLFLLKRNTSMGVANLEGKEVIPVAYDEIEIKGMYLQAIGKDASKTYFDAKGNQIQDNPYDSVFKTKEGQYFITIDLEGNYGILDQEGKILLENQYSYVEYLYDNYFIAANEQSDLGVINEKGDEQIPFQYEVLQRIGDSYVIEAKQLKENITDLYGNNLEKIYSKADITVNSNEKMIQVYSKDENQYFDFQGKEIEHTKVNQYGLYADQKNGKWGLIDSQGNLVLDYQYDRTTSLNEFGFAGICQNGKWGVVDQKGNIIQEPVYEISVGNRDPEFIGSYYKVYYGYGESYYTNE